LEFWKLDGDFVIERHVWPQEVVVGHDERGHGEGTVGGFEAAERADVELKSTVEPFNDLFKWPELGGDFVQVLEADDLFERDLVIFITFFVKEHDTGGVGRVSIGDDSKFLSGSAVRMASFMAMVAGRVSRLSATW